MGRPKKVEEKSQTVEVPLSPIKRKRGRPVATRHHQIVTAYAEEVPIDELNDSDDEIQDIETLDEAIESTAEATQTSETHNFLQKARESREVYEMVVWRLPNYDRDNRTDTRAPQRTRVGKIPFNHKTYQDDIAIYFAKPGQVNIFLPEIRKNGLWETFLEVVRVDPPSPIELAQHSIQAPAIDPSTVNTTSHPTYLAYPVPQNNQIQNPIDPFKEVDRTLGLITKMRQAFVGDEQAAKPPTEPQLSPKVALLSAMAEHPEIVESITDKLLGGNRGDKPPSMTELLIRHGGELFKGAKDFFVGVIQTASTEVKQIKMLDAQLIAQTNGANHLNPEMAAQALPNQTNQSNQIPGAQIQQEGTTGYQQNESRQLDSQPGQTTQETITDPKEILISIALNGCKNQTPPKVVANQLTAFADRVEEEAPHMSVYGWLDLFTEYDTDQIINFMQSGTMGENATSVAGLAHAHRWVGELRSLLKTEEENESA